VLDGFVKALFIIDLRVKVAHKLTRNKSKNPLGLFYGRLVGPID